MRRSILVASALATTLALAACSSGSGSGSEGEQAAGSAGETNSAQKGSGSLTVWVDETREKPVEQAAKAYEAESGVDVKLVKKNFEDIRTDFLAQVPSGKGPDITVGAHDWLGEFTSNGVVQPVELGDKADDFLPVSTQAFTQDGQVYGLPYAIENVALIRNTKLAPNAPKTYDDMVKAGKKAGTKFPFLIQTGTEGDPYTYYPFQMSFGAPVFAQKDDGTYDPELRLGGEKGEAFANWLGEEGEAGNLQVDVTPDVATDAFAKGKSPFIIAGPWTLEDFGDLDVAVSKVPAPSDEPARPFVGVQGFYVSAQSKNALAANDFLVNYMATPKAQTALFKAGGRPPALIEAADKASDDPVVAGFREVGAQAAPMPSNPEMGAVWAYWGVTEANIISGKAKDPAAAWDKMVGDIKGELG